MFLQFKEGRSDKAAKLHSVTRNTRQEAAMRKLHVVDESFASVSGGDYWAEKGEAGRWVRVHTHLRNSCVQPWKVPGEPGRRTQMTHERYTRGLNAQGRLFRVDDSWDELSTNSITMKPWTGRTIPIARGQSSGGKQSRQTTSEIQCSMD